MDLLATILEDAVRHRLRERLAEAIDLQRTLSRSRGIRPGPALDDAIRTALVRALKQTLHPRPRAGA